MQLHVLGSTDTPQQSDVTPFETDIQVRFLRHPYRLRHAAAARSRTLQPRKYRGVES